jgi:hypothetical protein
MIYSNNIIKYKLNIDQINELLYYETGFEQMHPVPFIYEWMQEQGYVYNVDWFCRQAPGVGQYQFEFPNEQIAELFILKWL